MASKTIGEMTPEEYKASMGAGPGATVGGPKPVADSSFIDKAINSVGKFGEAVGPAAFGLNKLMTGADAATTAVSGLTKGLSMVGLPGLGAAAGIVAKAFLDQKATMDIASKELGIGANNIGTFIRMSGEAGLTTKEFTDTIKK